MKKEKKKIGRPPAEWVHQLAKISLRDTAWVDAYELSINLGVPVGSIKAFLRKADVVREHEVIDGQVKAKFQIKDLRAAALSYLEPWL